MAKKSRRVLASCYEMLGVQIKGDAGKKVSGNKPRQAGMFRALKKQDKRAAVVEMEKSDTHKTKRKAKRLTPDEFQNFDERMAAKNSRRPRSALKGAGVISPTFVMAPPTFQFNANTMQSTPAPREVEGFHGFMSALNTPKDVPRVNEDHVARQSKRMQCEKYHGSNVFAVLDDGDEEPMKKTETDRLQTAPAFMQPATFTLATVKSTNLPLQSSLRQSVKPALVGAIDPDL